MSKAPDYISPVEGWRAWSVIRDARGTRLRSVYTDSSWDAGRAFTASCRRTCRRMFDDAMPSNAILPASRALMTSFSSSSEVRPRGRFRSKT